MKSSMTSIRVIYVHREREKVDFKSREVNCLKECALALTWPSYTDMGRRGSGGGGGFWTLSPEIFKIYISENNIFSVIRGVFACAFQKFQARFVRLLLYLFMYVLSPPFNDLAYNFLIFAEQPNPRRISQYTPTLVNVSKYGGVAVAEWLSSWLAEQEVRGSIPGLAIRISEIGYLLFPSRDMAEIPLKQR